jgi:hypothetical protein
MRILRGEGEATFQSLHPGGPRNVQHKEVLLFAAQTEAAVTDPN